MYPRPWVPASGELMERSLSVVVFYRLEPWDLALALALALGPWSAANLFAATTLRNRIRGGLPGGRGNSPEECHRKS